jgi:cysteine-rich repeat protein
MTWTVACGRVLLVSCLIALASCASQDATKVCNANGETYLCPQDTECGGVQRLCVKPGGCGNGVMDQGEQCDDGNTRDGDGCSHVCLNEVCGNGILDPGEICDDGNNADGDGCSADCLSKETCGNGIIDRAKGEVCDDGIADNHGDPTTIAKSGDGCSADCKSTEICGNHILDVGEACDDGNTRDGDGCSHDCLSTEACDNGLPDPGEECDHGKFDAVNATTGNINTNDCRSDCVINRCGDGYVDGQTGPHHEDCDGAPAADRFSTIAVPTETLECNIDCTSAHCGDGKVNKTSGEECDDHNNRDGDGCSHDCKIEFCGNGVVDNGEPCDFSVTPDTCNRDCTPSVCGDGKVNHAASPSEQCDDGNTAPGDGCSPLCQFERCGNHALDPGEQCDGDLGLRPCNVKTCLQETCGNGILDNDPSTGVHEECDDGGTLNGDGCSHDCHVERCGNGILDPEEQCDGLLGDQPCNALTCLHEVCGNGIRDDDAVTGYHEECDDGGTLNGDGCSHDCKREFCGDGVTNFREQCDPTDPAFGPALCNTDCTLTHCGDGKLNRAASEQCDDGNNDDGDGCSHDCHFERCGNGILDPQEQCDGALGARPCNTHTCLQETCGNGILDDDAITNVHEQCDDGGTLDGDGCSHDCKFEFCGDGIVNNHEQCDRALTPDTCNLDCTTSRCGDGKINVAAGEQCDDGGTQDGDGCSHDCKFERCGNHILDPGEDCDGPVGTQPCSAICHTEVCGNGILDDDQGVTPAIHEQCDDGGTLDGDGCSHDCKFEFCGDGIVNNHEPCDPVATPDTCNLDCTLSTCGDGKVNRFAVPPEVCDDGGTLDGDGCSHDCKVEFCGDGVVNNHEVCDPSVDPAHCNLDCTTSLCGDGKLNAAAGEQCDDGGTLGGDGCSPDCKFERCGNHILDPGEDCDGPVGTLQPCSQTCHQEICGNGILDDDSGATPAIHEQCDLGPANNDQGVCTTSCQLARCGDTFIQSGEQCDNGDGTGGHNNDHADCTTACQVNVCGDGFTDTIGPDHIELCDEGANNTDHPACAYNATCTACSTHCAPVTVHHACGDGVVDAPDEACDDRNTDACGSCSANCGVVTSKRATGFILAVSGLELADGEMFTLDDGVNPPEVFEFDTGTGVADGHVAVTYGTGFDATQVRIAIEAAIQTEHDAGRLLIAPHSDPTNTNDALALLSHDRPTSHGNHPITDTVGAPTFFAAGMFGGQGGNCGDNIGCGSDDDCTSHHCNAQHVCDTPAPGAPPRSPATRTARRAP